MKGLNQKHLEKEKDRESKTLGQKSFRQPTNLRLGVYNGLQHIEKRKCCKMQKGKHKSFPSQVYKRALDGHLEIFLEHYKCCMAEAINPHFGKEQEKIRVYKKIDLPNALLLA